MISRRPYDVPMLETRPGVYLWQAKHPDWEPDDGWDELVSAYALDDGERLIIIDPIAPPAELEQLAAERDATIVLTCPWHVRDSEALAERLSVPLYTPPPDPGDPGPRGATVYRAGDPLPAGLEAFRGLEDGDLVLWSQRHAAVIPGDSLIDRGEGLVLPLDWAQRRGDPDAIRQSLTPLLERDVEVVLPTHGLPTDREALARALAQP